jgi:hypothetical protein
MHGIADNRRTTEDARRAQSEANARALAAAHGGHVLEAMEMVRWRRRGLLQRLIRSSG